MKNVLHTRTEVNPIVRWATAYCFQLAYVQDGRRPTVASWQQLHGSRGTEQLSTAPCMRLCVFVHQLSAHVNHTAGVHSI